MQNWAYFRNTTQIIVEKTCFDKQVFFLLVWPNHIIGYHFIPGSPDTNNIIHTNCIFPYELNP